MAIWLLTPSIRLFRAPSVNSLNSSSASSSSSSIISATSTLEYGHEGFITFESMVRDLIRLIPQLSISPTATIEVTRMPGGLNYRIIGVRVAPETPKAKTNKRRKGKGENKAKPRTATGGGVVEVRDYILRLPRRERNNGTRLDREVAVLYYIEKCTTIPVPKTVAFDLEGVNGCPVGLPYVLQTRIAGVPLDEAFNQMTFEQKKRFVYELVDLYVKMDNVRFSRAGVLEPSPKPNCAAIEVESFDLCPGTGGGGQRYRSYAQQTTRDMLLSQFESWKIAAGGAPRSLGEAELVSGCMDKLILVTLQMEKLSCLGDDSNILFHPDLSPRNIFVTCTGAGDVGEWEISGVLDWESALSVPRVMANRAPSWLWRWGAEEGYDESDEGADGNVPGDGQRAELKRLFEAEMEAALPLFVGYAYKPCFRMLRRLCRFAVWGVRWKEDVDRVVEFLREWKELVADPFGGRG